MAKGFNINASRSGAGDRQDVFVFVDALGWDVAEPTGFLRDLLPHRRPMTMQFGYSCSAIPTILSGKRPEAHGHLGLFRYAPDASPFRGVARAMRLLRPKSFWRRGRVRGWLSRAVKRILGFTGYFQLYQMTPERLDRYDYCEKRDLFLPGGMEGVANLADALEAEGVDGHISDWHLSDAENFVRGVRAVERGKPFVFVYTSSLDALRHDHPQGAADPAVRARIDWYATEIRKLAEAAARGGRPWSLTVFSDHGMTPLAKTVDLKAAVEATGLVFGADYGVCYDSTLMRVYGLKPGALAKIRTALEPFAADGHWLTVAEERRHGIWREDRMFGDAIFLVNPGIQIVPSDMGIAPLGGMHGFDPDEAHSKAALLSTDPIPDWVTGVYDYFRLMTRRFAKEN